MDSRRFRSMLEGGLVDEAECWLMLKRLCRSMATSFSKRNDEEVYLPRQESLFLYSSFFLIIFTILLHMYGVCCHSGIVVIVFPFSLTTVDRFFPCCVGRFLMGIVDRCCSVSFDWRWVFSLVLGSTLACCNDSLIIDSSGGRMWLLDWNRVVVGIRIDEC